MANFILKWPHAFDVVPDVTDGDTPVTSQWLNMAADYIEIIQAEIGQDLCTFGDTDLRQILDAISNKGPTDPGRPVGIKMVTVTANGSFWNAGTNSITFPSSTGKNTWDPGKSGAAFATYVGGSATGAILNLEPSAIQGNSMTNKYWCLGAKGDGGALAGGTSFTFDCLLWQAPKF